VGYPGKGSEVPIRGEVERSHAAWLPAWVRREFDNQAIAPTVLSLGQGLNRLVEFPLGRGVNDTCLAREYCVPDSPMHAGIRQDVLHPLSLEGVLGDDVVAAVSLGEPDFDFARQAAPPPGHGQV